MGDFFRNIGLYLARPLTKELGQMIIRLEQDKLILSKRLADSMLQAGKMKQQIYDLDEANYKLQKQIIRLKKPKTPKKNAN